MGFLDFITGAARRAEINPNVDAGGGTDAKSDILRQRLAPSVLTKADALKIPALQASIRAIAETISTLPVRLYRVEEAYGAPVNTPVTDDARVRLLNSDPGDTLGASEIWRAIVEDYFMSSHGAYIYIERDKGAFASLRYVNADAIATIKNSDPIFKHFEVRVNGSRYMPHEFVRILRKTKDGIENIPIYQDNALLLGTIKATLEFERSLVAKGGNKKGFLQAAKKLSKEALASLKEAWRRYYGSNEENVIILNDGITFQESTNTAVEMQINENKRANSREVYGVFGVPEKVISGGASEQENINFVRFAVLPVARAITCALNRDLLLEKEKGKHFFEFDFDELERGDMARRYKSYRDGIEGHFLQIDEVRRRENLAPIGLNSVTLDLGSALYDPEKQSIYTLNTDKTYSLKDGKKEGNDGGQNGRQDEGQNSE
jgi:HK97 family phage portal protein